MSGLLHHKHHGHGQGNAGGRCQLRIGLEKVVQQRSKVAACCGCAQYICVFVTTQQDSEQSGTIETRAHYHSVWATYHPPVSLSDTFKQQIKNMSLEIIRLEVAILSFQS